MKRLSFLSGIAGKIRILIRGEKVALVVAAILVAAAVIVPLSCKLGSGDGYAAVELLNGVWNVSSQVTQNTCPEGLVPPFAGATTLSVDGGNFALFNSGMFGGNPIAGQAAFDGSSFTLTGVIVVNGSECPVEITAVVEGEFTGDNTWTGTVKFTVRGTGPCEGLLCEAFMTGGAQRLSSPQAGTPTRTPAPSQPTPTRTPGAVQPTPTPTIRQPEPTATPTKIPPTPTTTWQVDQ